MGLLRYQIFLMYGAVFVSVWYYALVNKESYDLSPKVSLLVMFAPVWGILALGIYLLLRLIVGVMTFSDVPEASTELEGHIAEAKAEMRRRKIIE
jgi:dolichyl-phosphate mannosyltransferase polypeptide 3